MRDEELREEIDAYVTLLIREKVRAGATPEDARRAALLEAGGAAQLTETVREAEPLAWFDRLAHDVRYGLRLFRRAPALNLAVVIVLALGIGATSATFAIVDAVLLRPLAFRNPDELVVLLHRDRNPVSPANFLDWQRSSSSFSSMGAAEYWTPTIGGTSDPERITAV